MPNPVVPSKFLSITISCDTSFKLDRLILWISLFLWSKNSRRMVFFLLFVKRGRRSVKLNFVVKSSSTRQIKASDTEVFFGKWENEIGTGRQPSIFRTLTPNGLVAILRMNDCMEFFFQFTNFFKNIITQYIRMRRMGVFHG